MPRTTSTSRARTRPPIPPEPQEQQPGAHRRDPISEAALAILAAAYTPALPVDVLAAQTGIPTGTMTALHSQKKGPRTFKIGRRLYVLRADWTTWLTGLATTGGVAVHGRDEAGALS